jgi:hypothetical protein
MEIVGESKYQPALRTMLARDGRSTTIRLEPEPENPHDANAIKVCDVATGATVGYIPRENAARYQAAAGTLAGEPLAAELVGGTGTKPSIGVYFNGRRLKDAVGEKPASVAGLGCGCLLILLLGLIALVAVVGLISDS